MSKNYNAFNHRVHDMDHCDKCSRRTAHREVLMVIACTPGGQLAGCTNKFHYVADWRCMVCGITQDYGQLISDEDDGVLVPAIFAAVSRKPMPELRGDRPNIIGGPDLPFGNR